LAYRVEELFRRESDTMPRLAYAMLGADGDAEEAVQEAFLGVAARWDKLENPGGYLRVSVLNGARKRK
jgi:DNA-directed RNA polymerase specialized sigma24 family protein